MQLVSVPPYSQEAIRKSHSDLTQAVKIIDFVESLMEKRIPGKFQTVLAEFKEDELVKEII